MDYIYAKLNYEVKNVDYSLDKSLSPAVANISEYSLTKEGVAVGDTIVIPASFKQYTTETRPTSVAEGLVIYDTTIHKPIYWNGTVWKDFAGTTV